MLSSRTVKQSIFIQRLPRWLLWLGGLLLAVLAVAAPLSLPVSTPTERTFHIEARSFTYTPEKIRVNPGDTITIELMATDVIHGIYIDGYDLKASADPGQIARLTFTADRPGMFRFRCAVPCGAMHPFMIGKLQVGPNLLLVRAVLLILISLVFSIIWLLKRPPAMT